MYITSQENGQVTTYTVWMYITSQDNGQVPTYTVWMYITSQENGQVVDGSHIQQQLAHVHHAFCCEMAWNKVRKV